VSRKEGLFKTRIEKVKSSVAVGYVLIPEVLDIGNEMQQDFPIFTEEDLK